jgi:hypothetical protein
MDESGRAWMAQAHVADGPAVGEAVRDRRGKSWQLFRAVRAAGAAG